MTDFEHTPHPVEFEMYARTIERTKTQIDGQLAVEYALPEPASGIRPWSKIGTSHFKDYVVEAGLEHIPLTFTRTPHVRRNLHILGR